MCHCNRRLLYFLLRDRVLSRCLQKWESWIMIVFGSQEKESCGNELKDLLLLLLSRKFRSLILLCCVQALTGSVRVSSVHEELHPDPNSTWTDWSASHFLGLNRVITGFWVNYILWAKLRVNRGAPAANRGPTRLEPKFSEVTKSGNSTRNESPTTDLASLRKLC